MIDQRDKKTNHSVQETTQKNIALYAGIIILIIGISLIVYANQKKSSQESQDEHTTSEIQNNSEVLTDNVPGPTDTKVTDLYYGVLHDVSENNASGTIRIHVSDGVANLTATFENLPDLHENEFYEGWLVENPQHVISTGKIEQLHNVYTNTFESRDDLTIYSQYILTLEPNDTDPAPAKHILEGEFLKQ